ncbi:class I SAM-dependent methyltransferase [Streptomyces sp. UNOB3_S3]|uniref:methyltransferase n=1 Tax=Streptomyces sp. UNOB3_S3 TaxID=2871682 RepID=UPI001E5113EA|nr:class I SAM-dependent methyltransferase [Streptomyces sp. UNOB3_S3]MCC3778771.1 class I SAM-dependent methyltransferase [Streptomyces sp. UNOB3_S3]
MSTIHWTEYRTPFSARWHSENATPPPDRVVVVDDRMTADTAHRLACEGTALLWRGDFHNARQLLRAMGRRVDRKAPRPDDDPARSFLLHRRARGHRARVLGRLLVLLEDDHSLSLRRAPDTRQACAEAYGPPRGATAVSLTELLGVLGAREWRRRGVEVPALGARIHPHYGVFAPVRGEYVDLVARAPLPAPARGRAGRRTAFDLGTGTGVLAAVLAHRGVERVVATDISPRALACARENARRLGLAGRVDVMDAPGLFPDGRADVVVCNPPWLPGRPASAVEQGVYDPGGGMLHAFLDGLASRLAPGGEGWLVLSDLAERLGLRTRGELLARIGGAGLRVVDRTGTRPRHPRARDTADPFHAARAGEVTSLWRLTVA